MKLPSPSHLPAIPTQPKFAISEEIREAAVILWYNYRYRCKDASLVNNRVRRDIKVGFSLINIGFGNMAAAARVMAIISPESAPVKRMIQDSRDKGDLIDATYGRKTRAVLIMDSGQIILSAVQPETISHRLMNKDVITSEGMDEN